MQGAEHKMPGLGRAQSNFYGRAVAHFADQNDLRRLAERCAQSAGESVKISAQFALVNRGFLLVVNELHRIFQRDDVN